MTGSRVVTRRDVLALGAGALGTLAAVTDTAIAEGSGSFQVKETPPSGGSSGSFQVKETPPSGGSSGSFAAKASPPTAEQAGFVQELLGNATASLNGNTRALAIKENVLVGDLVKTAKDAQLALLLGSRTTLRLGGGTELRLDQYFMDAGGEVDFTAGTIMFDRTGTPSESNLRFKTPYALIAVRGTAFYAGVNDGAFQVFVRRGKIEVSAAGKSVDVVTGQGTEVKKRGAGPTTPVIWNSERIRELRSKLSEGTHKDGTHKERNGRWAHSHRRKSASRRSRANAARHSHHSQHSGHSASSTSSHNSSKGGGGGGGHK